MGQCLPWRQEGRLELKKQDEDIEEKTKKRPEKASQIKITAVEAKQPAGQLCHLADQILQNSK